MKTKSWNLMTGVFCALCGVAVAAPQSKRVVAVDFAYGARAAVWKSDGHEIAVQSEEGVAIRDAATLRLKRFLGAKTLNAASSIYAESPALVAWCGDNLVFADVERNDNGNDLFGTTTLVSARDGHRLALWRGAVVSPDRRTLFFSNGKGGFRVLNFAARRWFDVRLPLRETHSKPAQIDPNFPKGWEFWAPQITFSPDGKRAADQVGDGRMRLWDVKSARITAILRDKVTSMAYPAVTGPVVWSPDGRKVATLGENPSHRNIIFEEGPNDGTINEHPAVVKIWDASSGALLQWFGAAKYDESAQIQLRWLDNDRLFAGAKDNFHIRSASRRKTVVAPQVKEGFRVSAPHALAPDGSRVLASNRLFVLNGPRAGWPSKPIFRAPPPLKNLQWSRDGQFLAASFQRNDGGGAQEEGVQVWRREARGGFALKNLGMAHSPMRIGWTRSNRVWSSDFYRITFWNGRKNWRPEVWNAPFIGRNKAGNSSNDTPADGLFALSDDQTKLELPDGFGDEIYRWNAGAKTPQLLFKKAQSGGFGEILSPDERFLCFWESIDNQLYLRMFDLKVPNRKLQLPHGTFKDAAGNSEWELAPVFSRDGQRLAWGRQVWKLPSGRLLAKRRNLDDGEAFAFNANGTSLLRGGPNGLQFFDPMSGKPTRKLTSDAGGIVAADWSPDGRFIALARRNVIEIYDVKANALATTLYAWPSQPTPQQNARDPRPDWLSLSPKGAFQSSATAKRLFSK